MSKWIAKLMYSSLLFVILFLLFTPGQGVLAGQHQSVEISKMEMLVIPGDERLSIIQTMYYQNDVKENPPYFIGLPSQYENFYILKGIPGEAEFEYQDDGVQINKGLPTGKTAVIVGYSIPMEDRMVTPIVKQPFITKQVDVIIQVNSLTVNAVNFLPHSNREQYGQNDFRRFTRLSLQANEPWPLLIRMYRGTETGKSPYQIAGEPADPSLRVIGHVHEKNIPKSVLNIFLIFFILGVGMISIRRSTKGI